MVLLLTGRRQGNHLLLVGCEAETLSVQWPMMMGVERGHHKGTSGSTHVAQWRRQLGSGLQVRQCCDLCPGSHSLDPGFSGGALCVGGGVPQCRANSQGFLGGALCVGVPQCQANLTGFLRRCTVVAGQCLNAGLTSKAVPGPVAFRTARGGHMVSIKLKSSAILEKEEMLVSEPVTCRLNTKKPTFRICDEVRGTQTDRLNLQPGMCNRKETSLNYHAFGMSGENS